MRGYDYRCDPNGIDLFIDHTLKNERSFIQALGRVGRCTDPCSRFFRTGLSPMFNIVSRSLPQDELSAHQVLEEQKDEE